ncbi:MAG: hypothetical protein Q9160_002948 [Pyrenula sp. 1 TL-2023]
MPLADLDDTLVSSSSSREMWAFQIEAELEESKARRMSKQAIDGCQSCHVQVAFTVRGPFNRLRSYCINFDHENACEAAEELLQAIPSLCQACRVISYAYILNVLHDVASYLWRIRISDKSISILEKNLQVTVEEEIYECSYIMFNGITKLAQIYADQGLLHEVELKLLQRRAEKRVGETLDQLLLVSPTPLADAVSEQPTAQHRFLVEVICQAQFLSRSRKLQRADYLFNLAKGLLDHSNLRLRCFFTV